MPVTVAEAFVTLRPDMSKFKSGVGAFFNAGGLATAIAAGSAAATGGLVAILKPAAQVEQSLDVLQNVTGANNAEMAQMSALARTLGADLTLPGTSSKDAAEGMVALAKGGLSVNDVMGASKGVLQLAAAGQLSNARAAEITANALNVFGLAGSQATRVADLLAGAAQSASGEVVDMADALQMSAAVWGAAGIPIEDLVTSIALLAQNGIIGSDAGTSLKQMLLQLQTPSKVAAKMMEAIGFNIYNANGQMKTAREIIADLTTATSGLTQEARDNALGVIFGSDAVRAANVLLREGTAGFDAMGGAVTRQGAAAQAAAALNKGLIGAVDGFKSAVSTAAIDLGTKLLPQVTAFVRSAAGMVNSLHLLGPALAIIGQELIAVLGPAFQFLSDMFVQLFSIITTNTPTMIGALVALGTAVALVLGPAGIAAVAIAGIIALLIGLQIDWNSIFASLPPPVQLALANVLESVQEWAGALGTMFNVVIFGINQVANAFIVAAKLIAATGAIIATVQGDFGKAQELYRRSNELEFNPIEAVDLTTSVSSAIHKLREQAEFSQNQGAVDAFEAAAAAAQKKNAAEADGTAASERAAAAAAAQAAALAQLAGQGTGALTSLDDLRAGMADVEDAASPAKVALDAVAQAAEDMAQRIKAAADRIVEQQTSDVVKNFFDALLTGADPDAAIATTRAAQVLQDQEWQKVVGMLHQKLGVEVPDEFRGMYEEMKAAQDEKGPNVVAEWQENLKQRLASVGRLPFANMLPPAGPTANTYNINVAVDVDAAGNIDTKALTEAIHSATVDARERDSLAASR